MTISARWLLLFAAVCLCPVADAGASPLEKACTDALDAALTGWKPATVTAEVAERAKQKGFDPIRVMGDFNGDGRPDMAVLISFGEKRKVAVCMGAADGARLIVIGQPYCSEYISISKAGSLHYNGDTKETEAIKHDGVSVACPDKAGATYLWEGGTFRQMIDAD